ncbi:hypothetical protein [Paraflavitalea speifideaquila]|uniref:hypothetical protein n=1 Tax=Paraflavitalea speifideaquila TaxID=3076558 RepID=UPI0028ED2D1E|nr:hypothetical protein [Paraflavitalea speifideiaquila]
MKVKLLSFLMAFFLLTACGGDDLVQQPVKRTEPTYYVLCDFSASQGNQSRQAIIQNADSLFKVMCRQHARIIYFDISAAQYEKPFFDYSIVQPSFVTGTKLRQREQEIAVKGDTLHRRMERICNLPSSLNTCIIRAIGKVANSMSRDIGPGKIDQPVKIVILSDLLEDCAYNNRRVNIDRGDFTRAFQILDAMPKPTATFSTYKDIEITLVASSQRTIKQDSLDSFWEAVFRKFDHQLTEPISVSLPRWAQEPKQVRSAKTPG